MKPRLTGLLTLSVAFGLAGPVPAAEPLTPRFVEVSAKAGLTSVFAGDWQYMVGGGVAAFDCNDDGLEDLYLPGGTEPATLFQNKSTIGGELAFAKVDSGLEFEAVAGAYPIDIDGDGIKDLVVLRVGQNKAMKGLGGCRFKDASAEWGFDGGDAWSTAFSATWEKGATWPTLAVGNYVDRRNEAFPWGSCTDNWLHRPAADRPGFAPPLALKPSFCPLSILFTDWNRSGTPSLRVSNDREYYKGGQEQMWRVEPGKAPALYTKKDGWKYLRIWGMGIASADLDRDGYPEYFLTSMADNKLQTLDKPADGAPVKPSYKDVAFAQGVTAHRPYTGEEWKPSTAWHAEFADVNNDGLQDLFVAKGNVSTMPDFAIQDPNNLLVQGADGKFVEMGETAGVASMKTARGAALADFNLDGLVDLVVVNRWENVELYRNTTENAPPAIGVMLSQDGPNRDAIGSFIEIRRGEAIERREVTIGGGHAGGSLGWRLIGLGDNSRAEIRVVWPDGEEGPWQTLDARTFYRLKRGAAPEIVMGSVK